MEVFHERIGGDFVVYGIGMTDLPGRCVLDGVDKEGAASTFSGFVKREMVPKQLVEGLGAGLDDGSGVV